MGKHALSLLLSRVALLACSWVAGCGRFGLELLPRPATEDDGGVGSDAGAAKMCVGTACTLAGCPDDDAKTSPGICGCGISDTVDADGDGAPDCIDFCPGVQDKTEDGRCACAAASADDDGDGRANCLDGCPFDAAKLSAGQCGCGASERDGDGDGTPDCVDECPADANKSRAGRCGCGVSEQDTDLDGTPDCVDRCAGTGQPYAADQSCGSGYCHDHNTPSTCVDGKETLCTPAAPLSPTDTTCDGVDDDCDGKLDDDFVASASSCGVGACASSGTKSCVNGEILDSCKAGSAAATDSDCDNIDDDCDGTPDDDYAGMTTTCGMGACSTMGALECVGGLVVDSCTVPTGGATTDATCNNIDDDCDGQVDEDYVATSTRCGVGACARSGSKTCVKGKEVDSCTAGTTTMTKDTVCNKIDDDCDGQVDEDYVVTSTSCGVGYCASTGQKTCVSGVEQNSCVPKAQRSTTDDAFTPGNGVDDDCDGSVDEDVPACNTNTLTYEAGQYTVTVPGNCHSLTVRLWGGGGASGQNEGTGSGGNGGPGGYAQATALVSGTINLYVGGGGASGCNNAGSNAGSATYNGGSGGSGGGENGADGAVAGGGSGGSGGNDGGRGYYGGGGGGGGSGGFGASGNGGGGGAATVLMVNGTRAAVAGGGGGGGGAQALSLLGTLASAGGDGGGGCSGNGAGPGSSGGGGGGGGVCQGSTVTRGSGTSPANSGSIPSGRASGGGGSCSAGGNGYATLTFAP